MGYPLSRCPSFPLMLGLMLDSSVIMAIYKRGRYTVQQVGLDPEVDEEI